ncbi:MAG: HdeD family acid-resistance protein [Elainella sp. C42_A2020_010]|nr:HdeD family acid-resistance protein [Elainella sp. C42_A2020_010]
MYADLPSYIDVRKSTGWIIALSIALIILGILAISSPVIASAFFTALIGWITLIGGVIRIIQAFKARPLRGFWWSLVVGIFYVIAGIYILSNIAAAVVALTFAFGILFIVEGIFTIIMAFTNRTGRGMSWLVALSGIVTLILGIMVLNRFPFSALWLIGLYVGISLLFNGIAFLFAALAARRAAAEYLPRTDEANY